MATPLTPSTKTKSSQKTYTCKDPQASNYSSFGSHKASLCEYEATVAPIAPIITETMDTTLETILSEKSCGYFTQHMRKGDRDGKVGQEKQEQGISPIINEVSFLQRVLNALGYTAGPADGIFGARTHNAVSSFQQAHYKTVLQPWNLSGPTGRFYQSTEVRLNEVLGCEDDVTLDNGVFVS